MFVDPYCLSGSADCRLCAHRPPQEWRAQSSKPCSDCFNDYYVGDGAGDVDGARTAIKAR